MKYIVSIPNEGYELSRICDSISEAFATINALNLKNINPDSVMRTLVKMESGELLSRRCGYFEIKRLPKK